VLINNAGLSLGRDNFSTADLDDWDTMMQTNVNGLIYVTKALMPIILANQTHIINMGSIAGKEVYEHGNVYCASKYAVDALSKSMRIDLLKHGIKVTAVHPGAVETEFSLVRYKGDAEKAASVYHGMQPLTGTDIAETIFYTTQLPAHVCINELTIMPTQQASTAHFHRT
jgi:NADP-dependent 3-hydroxy acid dehydrogenase YdfG